MTVKIDEHTAHTSRMLRSTAASGSLTTPVIVPAAVIVVEVLSSSNATRDTGAKLADYFRVASLRHYLIVRTDRPTDSPPGETDGIEARVVTAGSVQLDPPGIVLEVDRIYC